MHSSWLYFKFCNSKYGLEYWKRETWWRLPYKWRKICRNSLVIICNFYLENEGQGYEVQHSQWCHSMANINIYKRHHITYFCASIQHFWDTNISNFFLEIVGQTHEYNFGNVTSQWQISKSMNVIFLPFLCYPSLFSKYYHFICLTLKNILSSRNTNLMANIKIYKCNLFHCLFLPRNDRLNESNIYWHTHTHTHARAHTHTHTHTHTSHSVLLRDTEFSFSFSFLWMVGQQISQTARESRKIPMGSQSSMLRTIQVYLFSPKIVLPFPAFPGGVANTYSQLSWKLFNQS